MTTFSPAFEQTLHRSLAIANEELSQFATLEHLLLALLDDEDASSVIDACHGDLSELRRVLSYHLKAQLPAASESTPADESGAFINVISRWFFPERRPIVAKPADDAKPTESFQRVIQRAVIHVQSSGREVVTGANALAALFSEKGSFAQQVLLGQGITRYDVVSYISHGLVPEEQAADDEKISSLIEESSSSAPVFVPIAGRLHFEQTPAIDQIGERKALVEQRHSDLKRLCDLRANEHPEFKRLVDHYSDALARLGPQTGAYSLFMAGFDIEMFLKVKSQSSPDRERNPPLDADQLFATQSLIIAHAGLITLFPDIHSVTTELDRYRQMSESLDALRDRVLDPIFDQLSSAGQIFDNETLDVASEIKRLDESASNLGVPVTQGATSVKHSWIRGALGAIGQYLLKQGREVGKVARDSAVKEGVSHLMKHPDQLFAAMVSFLAASKPILLSLAGALEAQFGWIVSLLSRLGL
ncbi:Clp protease N-terminal domain-containing protein [Bradyrhizobium sp.]|uniref:Clp protease N-terminal domain-containing protein n=1 Tax=Bradyrhizobium sp. TaxID=376 RepID=UPI00352354D9